MRRNYPRTRCAQLINRAGAVAVLAALVVGVSAQTTTNRRELQQISSRELSRSNASLAAARAWARANGVPVRRTVTDPSGRSRKFVLVGMVDGLPQWIVTRSSESARTLGVDAVWPGGVLGTSLTGKYQVGRNDGLAGVWEPDGVADPNHKEFGGRVSIRDGATRAEDHATHVTGIMAAAGINPLARGLAFESRIDAYDVFNVYNEMAAAGANGLMVSNHSYGPIPGWSFGLGGQNAWYWNGTTSVSEVKDWAFGHYGQDCQISDQIAYNAPFYSAVYAAGNERTPPIPRQPFAHFVRDANGAWISVSDRTRDDQRTFDTLSGEGIAKNTISVGAISEITNYTGPASVDLVDFSSTGPADDGRIKPDFVSPGVDTFSTFVANTYGRESGTSMASPNVAGSIVLLNQLYANLNFGNQMRAATVRALLTHTTREAGPATGPDYQHGWGLVDVKAAAEVLRSSAFNPQVVQQLSLNQGQTIDIPVIVGGDGTSPFKITLAWTDPAATAVANRTLDSRTPLLVNDLDVRLLRSGVQFQPWTLNPDAPNQPAVAGDNIRDNVEQILVPSAPAGIYTIRISHKGTALRPAGSQAFSLITTYVPSDGFRNLTLSPGTVTGGAEFTTGLLSLEKVASTDTVVKLSTNNVRAAKIRNSDTNGELNITIPAGQDRVEFPIDTFAVRPTDGSGRVSVIVTAFSDKGIRSGTLFVLPVGLSGFEINPGAVAGGNMVEGTITLATPAPSSGAAVRIMSDRPSLARPERNWITIPAGQRTAKVRVRTFATASPEIAVLTADRLGNTIDVDLAVNNVSLASIAATPANAFTGQQVRFTVSLDGPATRNGATVQLSSSNTSALTVPATVTIPAGRRSAVVLATANRVSDATQVTVAATRLNIDRTVNITVRP